MATPHTCHIDCRPEVSPTGGTYHVMYPAPPSSAAGRYQWEQNAAIKRLGRRAWRATGQGQSRECRVWDYMRRAEIADRPAEFAGFTYLDRPASRARARRLNAVLDEMAADPATWG